MPDLAPPGGPSQVADQKVTLTPHPPDPVVSRPLKTGANFVLVLPKKRFVYRHWDKEKYVPGEDAELIMEGEGIGSEKYEFIIEKADTENGPWSEVTTLKADGNEWKVSYSPGAKPGQALSSASISGVTRTEPANPSRRSGRPASP